MSETHARWANVAEQRMSVTNAHRANVAEQRMSMTNVCDEIINNTLHLRYAKIVCRSNDCGFGFMHAFFMHMGEHARRCDE